MDELNNKMPMLDRKYHHTKKGHTPRYAYLICQGPLWKGMNASRGDVVVKVTKVTMMR